MTANDCLFILRQLPPVPEDGTARASHLALDTALAAAALDRPVTLLLADRAGGEAAIAALRQADDRGSGPLALLRAADLFGIGHLVWAAPDRGDTRTLQCAQLPLRLSALSKDALAEFVAGFGQVFSYP